MIALLCVWVLCFVMIFLIGFLVIKLLGKINNKSIILDIDEIYFIGFAIISLLASYFSIFIPLNYTSLGVVCISSVIILILFRNSLKSKLNSIFGTLKTLHVIELTTLFFIIIFIAINSSYGIRIIDTGLYHAQTIKWIREFAVVPGLGNLHGRLAFNSMVFPISSVFTIDTSSFVSFPSILIYPLNSITLIVFLFKEYFFIRKNIIIAEWRNVIFGIIISVLCLGYLTIFVSSPSADVICTILIIYVFQMVLEYKWNMTTYRFSLLITLVFLCITIKLSSVLLVLLILPFLFQKKWFGNVGIIALIGLLVVLPFLIRNYYLSGYLVYPFPNIDIFNVDWKIPIDKVIKEKLSIELWARIPKKPFDEILNLSFNQWIGEWYVKKDIIMKSILICNLLTIGYIVYFFIKRQFLFLILYTIILANLLFWLITAPDPRFVYGFLFLGLAFPLSNFTLIIKRFGILNKLLFRRFTFLIIYLGLSVLLSFAYLGEIITTIKRPYNWIFPTNMESTETNIHKTNFEYYSPVSGTSCFNTSIPCTPYPNKNLVLRKNSIKDGFMLKFF